MSRSTVADVIVDGLRRAGTPRLFGLARGRADHPLLEAARAMGLPVVLAAGEAGAWVMAGVTGDLVDAPGAVVLDEPAVSAAEMRDRAPVILLTSGHPSAMQGCKETLPVETESAAHRIAHATRLAMSEPRGPVHLDISGDVARSAAIPLATSCRPDPLPYPDGEALDRAGRALSGASRPLLLAGLHARSSDAAQWLRAFVEALPAPFLTTARAKGALPDPHPLMLGVLGVGGVEEDLLKRADLVVAIGLDTLEAGALPEACWSSPPMLVIGPAAVPDGRVPAVHVVGDVGAVIEELAIRLRDKPRADWDVADVDRLRREGAARAAGDGLASRVVRLAREATPAGTIATVGAGAYRGGVASAWHAISPREFLASSSLTAGFALPAALAAHLVHPDRRVVCFTDANELGTVAAELETAVRLAARIILIVYEVDGTDASSLVRLAESIGLSVDAVDNDAKFSQAFGRAFTAERGSLIVVQSRGVP